MSSRGSVAARSVFVGNIPYEATEEDLHDIFSEVGEVMNFRLVFDKETGKPKGFGFCEYKDEATALSAMRNLNNREFAGRSLRVDTASDKDKGKDQQKPHMGGGGGGSGGGQNYMKTIQPAPQIATIPGLVFGKTVSPSQSETVIRQVIEEMKDKQLYDFVTSLQTLINSQPDQATYLLTENPQLAFALLQAQVRMGILTQTTAQEYIETAVTPNIRPPQRPPVAPVVTHNVRPPVHRVPPPQPPPNMARKVPMQQPPITTYDARRYDPPASHGYPDRGPPGPPAGHMGGPPGGHMGAHMGGPPRRYNGRPPYPGDSGRHMPPPVVHRPHFGGPPDAGIDKEQLMRQVMNLSPEQIAQLDPQQAKLLMDLKKQLGSA